MKDSKPYPAPTGPYKVAICSGVWRGYDRARFQISMCNPKHTGDKFFALCEWASHRFDEVVLIVSDTLRRHNVMMECGASPDVAYQAARQLGTDWLEENAASIALLPNPVITRWDQWLQHKDFPKLHNIILDLYAYNREFAAMVDAMLAGFVARQKTGVPDSFLFHSRNFILEELAAYEAMFRDHHAVDIYPGSGFVDIMNWLRKNAGFTGMDRLTIDYVRNKGLQLAA